MVAMRMRSRHDGMVKRGEKDSSEQHIMGAMVVFGYCLLQRSIHSGSFHACLILLGQVAKVSLRYLIRFCLFLSHSTCVYFSHFAHFLHIAIIP